MQGKVEICGVNTARLKTLSPAQMDALLPMRWSPRRSCRSFTITTLRGFLSLHGAKITSGPCSIIWSSILLLILNERQQNWVLATIQQLPLLGSYKNWRF